MKRRAGPRFTQEHCDSLPKFDRSVSLVCWAYNEEDLIGEFLERANALMDKCVEDYEIVVVDDCSTDRTNQIVRDFAKRMPQVRLIRNERNLNVGMSCRRAIAAAGKEYLFWQTVDWSYDINLLRGHLETHPQHLNTVADSLTIESDEPIPYALDGDIFRGGNRLSIRTGPRLKLVLV